MSTPVCLPYPHESDGNPDIDIGIEIGNNVVIANVAGPSYDIALVIFGSPTLWVEDAVPTHVHTETGAEAARAFTCAWRDVMYRGMWYMQHVVAIITGDAGAAGWRWRLLG